MYIFYKKGRRKPNKISETRRTTVTVKITREKKKSHNGNEHRAGNKKAASKTTFSHSQRVEKREVNHQLQKQEKEAHTYTLHMAHSLRSYTPQCSTALLLLLSPYKCQRVRSVIPERIRTGYMEPLLEKWNLWRENCSTVANLHPPTPHMVVVVVVVVVV